MHIPTDDAARLDAVRRYNILDTPPDGTFDRVTELAAQLFDVPIVLVTIVDEDRIWFKSRYGLDEVTEIPRDPGLCASAICQDATYVIERAREDPRSIANPLVAGEFGLQFYAAAPLKTGDGHNLGTFCLLDRKPREFGVGDRALLTGLAAIVVNDLELRLQALQVVSAERVLRRDAAFVADTLQHAMLPQSFPQISGVTFDANYIPATRETQVGGDWYDAFLIDDGHLLLTIGDVAGHGLHAATLMGKVRQSLRTVALDTLDPADILWRLDRVLRKEDPDTMVTAVVGILEVATRTLRYANAGHPAPLLRNAAGDVVELSSVGLPLGLRTADEPKAESVRVAPRSTLVFFTDGLTEATHDVIEGEAMLRAALRDEAVINALRPANALSDLLLADGSADDVAILTVTFA
ncbi:MAG: SpoIIE family protein phosphatase [Candidatus Eremiobacteraeota bacterium]|nr:SpoIIE family protein phosphatase [Candidatus Eremiobacteraeota bacterium]